MEQFDISFSPNWKTYGCWFMFFICTRNACDIYMHSLNQRRQRGTLGRLNGIWVWGAGLLTINYNNHLHKRLSRKIVYWSLQEYPNGISFTKQVFDRMFLDIWKGKTSRKSFIWHNEARWVYYEIPEEKQLEALKKVQIKETTLNIAGWVLGIGLYLVMYNLLEYGPAGQVPHSNNQAQTQNPSLAKELRNSSWRIS